MTKLTGHANGDMAHFGHGVWSEVCCDCDTAAGWKEGLENGKQGRRKEKRRLKRRREKKERTNNL